MIDISKCTIDSKTVKGYSTEFNRVSKIHKYWSRKPFHLVENCIKKYSKRGNLVLDPFCGSGTTGLESILNNRRYIGYDLNPAAIFISECTLDTDFNLIDFKHEMDVFISSIKSKIMDLYRISDTRFILYTISGKTNKCYNAVTCDYNFQNKDKQQLDNCYINKDVDIPVDLKYPDKEFPKQFYKDRFSYKGVKYVSDMFTRRNLYALALLYNSIHSSQLKYKKYFILAFSNMILHASKLKGENVRPLGVNNYWIPDDNIEENVIWRYIDRLNNICLAKEQIMIKSKGSNLNDLFELRNKSSILLDDISSNTVDYIITDPPYGDVIQYSELSYIWNCWLEKSFQIENEVIINPVQGKKIEGFQSQLKKFVENGYRVLKPNGYFTLCFQNKDIKIWLDIILNIKHCGFQLHDIKIYDTFGSPFNKYWAKFSPKADLYVTFVKSNKKNESDGIITPEVIIDKVLRCTKMKVFDLNKGYDLFVAEVINEVFSGKKITGIDTLSLKKVIALFKSKKELSLFD